MRKPASVIMLSVLCGLLSATVAPCAATWQAYYPAADILEDIFATVECLQVKQPPVLDGVPDEAAWQQVRPAVAAIDAIEYCNHTSQLPTAARFLYDAENIYVFFEAGPPPPDAELPEPAKLRLYLDIDPWPEHINASDVTLYGDGSAKLTATTCLTCNVAARKDQLEGLPQPTGKALVADGRLRGEFAIPIAGLITDPPALGDTWDLGFRLRTGSRGFDARWGTDWIPGRMRFVATATPLPAYSLTGPDVPVTPHHGRFLAYVTVAKNADGPMPTEVTVEGIDGTGARPASPTSHQLSAGQIGKPIPLVVELPAPGWGALRYELRRGSELMDTLIVPVQTEPAFERFADLPSGSFDCHISTPTVGRGDPVEGHLTFAPAQPGIEAHVEFHLYSAQVIGSDTAQTPVQTVTIAGDGPRTVPLSLGTDGLRCGIYRVTGVVKAAGKSQAFASQPVNFAGDFITDYDAMLDSFDKRLARLARDRLKYPFQLDSAQMLLHLVRRHGAAEFSKLSKGARNKRGWWPIEWVVQLADMLPALEANRDYFAGKSGKFLCAYRSKLDGMIQPYEINLPEGFDKRKQWPVLMAHHGGTSAHFYYSLIGLYAFGYQPLSKWPLVCVGLEERHHNLSCGAPAQAADFLEVYDEVKQHFGMDTQRVSTRGLSTGGTSAWTFPIQMPHLFNVSYPAGPWGYSYTGQLANVRHVLMHSYHGRHDPNTCVANSQVMTGALDALGGRAICTELRVGGHGTFPAYRDRSYIERLLKLRAPEYPDHVEFVCTEPRYSRAYWATIERLIDYRDEAHMDIRVVGRRTIRVDTTNIGALSLDLSGGQIDRGKPVRIVLNGEARTMPYADTLRLDIQPLDGELMKRPGLSGPLGDWILGKSLIVCGTQAGGELNAAYEELAEQVSHGRPLKEGKSRWSYVYDYETDWPVKSDKDVTAEDIRDCNLVLLGGPGANLMATRLADKLPVKFSPDGLRLGDLHVTGPDAAVAFIYPNPENPDRYIVVAGSADPAHKPGIRASALRGLSADVLILGGENKGDLPALLHFDAQWQLQPPQRLCEVPAGNKTLWCELVCNAMLRESAANVAFVRPYGTWKRAVPEGPLYCTEVTGSGGHAAVVSFKMTGAEFADYLRSWITLYGDPPFLGGVQLDWSVEPTNRVIRIDSISLDPERQYEFVADEITITRGRWAMPEHVEYHVLPFTVTEAIARHIELGCFGTAP